MSVYYFKGKEMYLKKQEVEKITSKIEFPELNVKRFHEETPELFDFAVTTPLIGDKKIGILYYIPDSGEFVELVKDLPDFTDLYIISSDFFDQRKKASKELLSYMTVKEFEKIDENLLFKCISSRLLRFGYASEEIAGLKDVLMEAFHSYIVSLDMDLDVVQKHVQMIGFSGKLTPETIRTFAPECSDLRAFRLSTMILEQDMGCLDYACRLIEQGENAIGLMSLIAYQIRICYKAVLFSDENYLSLIGIRSIQLYQDYRKYSAKQYKDIYSLLMESIRRIKKGESDDAVMADCLTNAVIILKEV